MTPVAFTAVAQRDTRPTLPLEELRQFSDVFGAIKSNYVENVEDKKLINEAISGMLSGLDPHSAFLDAKAYKEMQLNTSGQFGGIGIEIGIEDGFIKVIAPIEDTPAERAGIRAADLIVKTYIANPTRVGVDTFNLMSLTTDPETVYAAGGATMVWVDFKAQKAISWPADMKEKFLV